MDATRPRAVRCVSTSGWLRGLTAGLVLAGCQAPPPQIPEPERPSGPLTRQQAVALALRNNPDLWQAQRRIQAAQEAVKIERSYFWPQLGWRESFTRTDVPSQAFSAILNHREYDSSLDLNDPGAQDDWHTGIGAGWLLFDGGRRTARTDAATAQVLSADAALRALRSELALQVVRTYHLYFKARDSVSSEQRSVTTLEAHLRIVEARREAGVARPSDVLSVRVRLAEARESVIRAHSSSERALALLHLLLGLPIEEPLELIPADLDQEVPALEGLSRLLEAARWRRAELLGAAEDIVEGRARVQEALAGYWPQLELHASLQWNDSDPLSGAPYFGLGGNLWQSLTEVFRTPARVRQAVADLEIRCAAARKALLQVELDVKNALLDAEEAEARHVVASEAVLLAEESLHQVEAEYQEGTATITRLLDAELAANLARMRLDAARHDRIYARLALDHAVGNGPEGIP